MPLSEPLPFDEAIQKVSERIPAGRPWNTADWADQALSVRERAFFSARVENEQFLQRAKTFVKHFIERTTDEDGKLVAGSMSQFVEEMRAFAIREGMGKVGVPDDAVNEADLTDIRSEARLRLIFQTNVNTSYGHGEWRQSMHPTVLDTWPAARFVRLPGAKEPRPRHVQGEGDIRLKTDYAYWAGWQNAPEIGGFQTPWAPFGFNSFMAQEDVSRAEAEKLGLVKKEKQIPGTRKRQPTLNHELRAAARNLSPEAKDRLLRDLRGVGRLTKGEIRYVPPEDRD